MLGTHNNNNNNNNRDSRIPQCMVAVHMQNTDTLLFGECVVWAPQRLLKLLLFLLLRPPTDTVSLDKRERQRERERQCYNNPQEKRKRIQSLIGLRCSVPKAKTISPWQHYVADCGAIVLFGSIRHSGLNSLGMERSLPFTGSLVFMR